MAEQAIIAERFWSKVQRSDGCWTWKGPTTKVGGYGSLRYLGKQHRAHRVSWHLVNGEWPPNGLFVCHRCDNPTCVRPDHLFLGTAFDNNRDRHEKGRTVLPSRLATPEEHARGERHGKTHLRQDQVLEIFKSGEEQQVLAEWFGVSVSTIAKIQSGRSWAHLTGAKAINQTVHAMAREMAKCGARAGNVVRAQAAYIVMEKRIAELQRVLAKCADKFEFYEQCHRLKCTADGDEKADRNRELADMCRATLFTEGKEHEQ